MGLRGAILALALCGCSQPDWYIVARPDPTLGLSYDWHERMPSLEECNSLARSLRARGAWAECQDARTWTDDGPP